MTTAAASVEKADRLIELAMTLRVWLEDEGPVNRVAGLIELCEEWIGPDCRMVEVGCFAGVSTEVFSLFAAHVWAVDPHEDLPFRQDAGPADREMMAWAKRTFTRRLRRLENVVALALPSLEAAGQFPDGSLDAVYLDGDHSPAAVAADIAAWLFKLRSDGLLMGHDYPVAAPILGKLELDVQRVYADTSWVVVGRGRRAP